jgi:hypothetical protein
VSCLRDRHSAILRGRYRIDPRYWRREDRSPGAPEASPGRVHGCFIPRRAGASEVSRRVRDADSLTMQVLPCGETIRNVAKSNKLTLRTSRSSAQAIPCISTWTVNSLGSVAQYILITTLLRVLIANVPWRLSYEYQGVYKPWRVGRLTEQGGCLEFCGSSRYYRQHLSAKRPARQCCFEM